MVTFLIRYLVSLYPGGSDGKESVCNARDLGSIPESGRSPGEGTMDVGNLISGSSAFSKSSLNMWKFMVQDGLNKGQKWYGPNRSRRY